MARAVPRRSARTQTNALAGHGAFAWSAGFTAAATSCRTWARGWFEIDAWSSEVGRGQLRHRGGAVRAGLGEDAASDRDARALENLRMNLEVNREMDGDRRRIARAWTIWTRRW